MRSARDRIASSALLDAAFKDTEVLAQVINKYGAIQVRHDDNIGEKIENIETRIHSKVVQSILDSRRHDFVSHVNEIIDRIMGLNSVTGEHRHIEKTSDAVTHDGQSGTTDIVYRRRRMQQSIKHGLNPSALIEVFTMLTVLEDIVNKQRKKQINGRAEE
ncbi:hypothetical protein ACFLUO_06995 [Chloroflexota bacterium]